MRPVTVNCVIDRPREQVFDYLADLANHVEFTDHFARDFRLERLDSRGVGAAARFRVSPPLGSIWAELVLTELDRPYRIASEGRAGRIGRIPITAEYRLTRHGDNMTTVELTFASEPSTRTDRLRETLGARPWLRHQCRRAMDRLRFVLEEGRPSARAAGVAAG